MKVLIELTLCINLIINSFILNCTALFFKTKAKLWFLSASLGAIVALLLPLFHLPSYARLLIQIFLALSMASLSFNVKPLKKFLLILATFLGMTFIFGGACYALSANFGDLPLFVVLIIATVVYVLIKIALAWKNKVLHVAKFSFKVKIDANGKVIEEEGFLDSGNMLYDPITKKPIVLINFDVFSKIYQDINLVNIMLKNVELSKLRDGHYVKINTVTSGASILVFTADEIVIEEEECEKKFDKVSLGLTFSGFEKALGRKILLHSELV